MTHIKQIDNLRALAVLAVLANHFHESLLPSGFLGVDVFFVISGFVVTKSILSRKAESFLTEFYLGRIKRLYPALLFCVLTCSILSLLLLTEKYSEISVKTGARALIGFSNEFLIYKSYDYFSLLTSLNVFTHTWSLGVEEQFYFIYPALFAFIVHKLKKSISIFKNTILILSVISLAFYTYSSNEIFTYYSLVTRFWQIALGAITWLSLEKFKSKFKFDVIILLILIIIICFFLPVNYQQYSRILVSLGTSLVLASIANSPSSGAFILNNDQLNLVGRSSYSLYLWHWPILVLFRNTVGISLWSGTLAGILICFMTYISYNCIEFRFKDISYSRPKLPKTIAFTLLMIVTSLLLYKSSRLDLFIGAPAPTFSLKSSEAWNFKYCSLQREEYRSLDYKKCLLSTKFDNQKPTIFMFGNSYSQQMAPSMLEISKRNKLRTFIGASSGCHPLPLRHSYERGKFSCWKAYNDFKKFVFNEVKPGDKVVLSFSNNFLENDYPLTDGKKDIVRNDVLTMFERELMHLRKPLSEKGAKLLWISTIPFLKTEPQLCYQVWSKFRDDCKESMIDNKKTDEREKVANIVKGLCLKYGIEYIDLFPVIKSNVLRPGLYYNLDHISTAGAQFSTSFIKSFFNPQASL